MNGSGNRSGWIAALALLVAGCQAGTPAYRPGAGFPDRAAAIQEYNRLSPDEQRQVLQNPEGAAALAEMSPAEREEALEQYRSLSPEDQAWVQQNPDAARALGDLPAEERDAMMERYRNLPPAMQEQVRQNPDAYMPR